MNIRFDRGNAVIVDGIDQKLYAAAGAKLKAACLPKLAFDVKAEAVADADLAGAERAAAMAGAKLAELSARRAVLVLEGDARKLVAIDKDLGGAKASAAEAEDVARAAREIFESHQQQSADDRQQREGAIIAQARAVIADERTAAEADLRKAIAGPLARLAAAADGENACMFALANARTWAETTN